MSLDLAIRPPFTGVHVVAMDRPRATVRLAGAIERWSNRAQQALLNHLMRRVLTALDGDRADLIREVNRLRAWRMRVEPPHPAHASIEAVRVAAPYREFAAPSGPADWFAPIRGEPSGFVFYVHGGSFAFERSPAVTDLVAQFAAAAGARVFAPNYRLAPEHPCPAAVDDVVDAFRWFRRNWPDEPVVALAESAGASILLAALQRARRVGLAMPDGVLLLSPWVDLSLQSWSVIAHSLAGTTGTTAYAMAMMAHLYLGDIPATDPVASPLFGDFSDFPPILIHASRADPLHDDSVRLAERIRAENGDLTVRLWTAEGHVWEKGRPSANARQSIELGAAFIRERLGQP
ncbi:MAG TPA: alpha/beta hydrolase [Caulobacteraceae bacterium]|nr:alpha/beta hydrolase [Caulobacteraceae bacterium]